LSVRCPPGDVDDNTECGVDVADTDTAADADGDVVALTVGTAVQLDEGDVDMAADKD